MKKLIKILMALFGVLGVAGMLVMLLAVAILIYGELSAKKLAPEREPYLSHGELVEVELYEPGDTVVVSLEVPSVRGIHKIEKIRAAPKPISIDTEGVYNWSFDEITKSGVNSLPSVLHTVKKLFSCSSPNKEKPCGEIKLRLPLDNNLYEHKLEFEISLVIWYLSPSKGSGYKYKKRHIEVATFVTVSPRGLKKRISELESDHIEKYNSRWMPVAMSGLILFAASGGMLLLGSYLLHEKYG